MGATVVGEVTPAMVEAESGAGVVVVLGVFMTASVGALGATVVADAGVVLEGTTRLGQEQSQRDGVVVTVGVGTESANRRPGALMGEGGVEEGGGVGSVPLD